MSVRALTFLIWAGAAASAVAWGLKLVTPKGPLATRAPVASAGPALRGDPARVLGADAPAPTPEASPASVPGDTRFQLLGLVAPRSNAATAIALIAVDGKPARAYRLGTTVDTDLVLKRVQARKAELGPAKGPTSLTLELPPLGAGPSGSGSGVALGSVAGSGVGSGVGSTGGLAAGPLPGTASPMPSAAAGPSAYQGQAPKGSPGAPPAIPLGPSPGAGADAAPIAGAPSTMPADVIARRKAAKAAAVAGDAVPASTLPATQ